MLHEVEIRDVFNREMYCGPTVVAAVTGMPSKDIYEMFKAQIHARKEKYGERKFNKVTVCIPDDIAYILNELGYSCQRNLCGFDNGGTLRQFCAGADLAKTAEDKTLLIFIRGHVLAYRNGKILDTATRGKLLPWKDMPRYLKSSVRDIWVVKRKVRVRNFHTQIMDAIAEGISRNG